MEKSKCFVISVVLSLYKSNLSINNKLVVILVKLKKNDLDSQGHNYKGQGQT